MTLRLEVWDARIPADYARWEAVYRSWPKREAFAHPTYVSLFAAQQDRPLGLFAQTTDGWILYPLILRQIPEESYGIDARGRKDIISPYGYGGPFVAGDGHRFADSYWKEFNAWALSEDIVSEFVRFALTPDSLLGYPGEREQKSLNVVRSLDPSDEEMWNGFEHKVRKNVNKAKRSGVRVEIDTHAGRLDAFLDVYAKTMDRRSAAAPFYFPRSFFEAIVKHMPEDFAFLYALHEERVISVELALLSAENAYSFLGGTEEDAFDLRPNDLLKYELIRWSKLEGKRRFVLGGGYAPDDGIFRYKRAFAPDGLVPFFVGKRIFQAGAFDRLVAARRRAGQELDAAFDLNPQFFPAYRAPLPGG